MADLYRTEAGRERIREWCTARLNGWQVPHETTLVETHLGRTHVLQAGTGPAAVLYLPGTNFNTATSLTLLAHLSPHCRVLAVDLPGQPGLSTPQRRRDAATAYESWISDVRASPPMEGIVRVVLAGHSRGGFVALCADPAEWDGLVLLNPAGLARAVVGPAVLRTGVLWTLRPTEARTRALLKLMVAAEHEPDPDLVSWLTLVAKETRTTGAPGPARHRFTDRWRPNPVVVLSGASDRFFPADRLAPAARSRLGAEPEVLANVGHLSVDEAPAVVAERILGTLSTTQST